MSDYSKLELLVLIKNHNKNNIEKIKNVDKLKKEELQIICKKYGLLSDNNIIESIDLRNISKKDLLRDVEIWYMKQKKDIPQHIISLKKKELIDFMELNNIQHYTQEILESEIKKYEKQNKLKDIIIYNIMKYDNIDVSTIDNDNLERFIDDNKLDTDIKDIQQYAKLLHNLYVCYDEFCKSINKNYNSDKIKSFPKILQHIKDII